MSKVCFVISPLGPDGSATKKRADYVLETYIIPACERASYDPVRGDRGTGRNIVQGTTTVLQNAPMAVAYMGSVPNSTPGSGEGPGCWNANVMIEIGYRLASRLPLIFLCDQDSRGNVPNLPLNLSALRVIGLPRPDLSDHNWVDPHPERIVNSLVRQFQDEEEADRLLDSMHPVAAINAASSQVESPSSLYYTAASNVADDVFGAECAGRTRLVGRTMEQFLASVQNRMHPNQWRAFACDQRAARSKLQLRASGADKQSVASVPIVFETHENEEYNHRAFLPIVVEDYRPQNGQLNWYSLRVLYLNVTTATEKEINADGKEFYVCRLDPTSSARLEPLEEIPGIRVFLSYRSDNRANVLKVYKLLRGLAPYIHPFIDVSMNKGDNWLADLQQAITRSELCFLFLDDREMGPGQGKEVDAIQARLFTRAGKNYPVVPVLLRSSAKIPVFLTNQWVAFEELTELKLKQILWSHFPKRSPDNWRPNDADIRRKLPPPRKPHPAPRAA
jgi:hypothetical protein